MATAPSMDTSNLHLMPDSDGREGERERERDNVHIYILYIYMSARPISCRSGCIETLEVIWKAKKDTLDLSKHKKNH